MSAIQCYLALYVFCGEHLLPARLRSSNIEASAGTVEEFAAIIERIRTHWPKVQIVLRADSGFAREAILVWCEEEGIDFVIGLRPARVFCAYWYRTQQSRPRAAVEAGLAV